jgi:hypothetical protein
MGIISFPEPRLILHPDDRFSGSICGSAVIVLFLTFVPAHKLALGQYMIFHGFKQFGLCDARFLHKFGIQRIDPEIIAMCSARGAWPAVADPPEIVKTLFCSVLQNSVRGYTPG